MLTTMIILFQKKKRVLVLRIGIDVRVIISHYQVMLAKLSDLKY